MTYLISATLFLLATAAVIGAFTLNLRRLVSAIHWGRILVAEVAFLKKLSDGNLVPGVGYIKKSKYESSPNWGN